MIRLHNLAASLLLLSLLALAACASGAGSRVTSPGSTGGNAASPTSGRSSSPVSGLAALLPSPAELAQAVASSAPRGVSSCESVAHSGAAFEVSLPLQHVGPGIGTATFTPATVAGDEFSTMAFAVYRIDAVGYSGTPELHTYWDTFPGSGNVWIGAANFMSNRWDWYELASPALLNFGALANHHNALGSYFMAVAVLGSGTYNLKLLRLGPPDVCGDVVISLQASIAPTTKSFDISGLYVTGTTITGCDWDFNNDGTVDDFGLGVHTHSYPVPGDFPLRLTVHTDLGDAITKTVPLTVLTGVWDVKTVAFVSSSLFHYYSPQIALVDGKPMLAYIAQYDGDPPDFPAYQTLELSAADDRLAHSWHYVIQPYPLGVNPRVYSLIDAGGLPIVLAANNSGGLFDNPELLHPTDQTLLNWGTIVYADSLSGTDREAAMAIVDGNIAIAFRNNSNHIMYVYANGLDLSMLSPTLDTTWDCNGALSLADVNGFPAIATTRFSGVQQVVYLFSTSHTGDLGTWSGYFSETTHTDSPALAWAGGMPLIAADGFNDMLIAAGDAPDGTGGVWRSITPGWGNGIGDWCSIAGPCLDGVAGVASMNQQYNQLAFALVHDDGVNLTAALSTVDAPAGVDVGRHCELICVDGVPMIAYEDTTNQAVKVAVMR